MKRKFAPYFVTLGLASLVSPSHASSSYVSADNIEEVLVSAQKRGENLNKVPIAIDVVSGDTVENSSLTSLSQLDQIVPSMNFGRAGRKARGEITIRGVGDFSRNIGTDARVAIYIDDVPLGRSTAYDIGLVDLERIEFLNGPQGTLFGTNSIAGAVNIITPNPADEFGIVATTGTGNLGQQNYSVRSDLPISSSIKSRVVFAHHEEEGFIENLTRNETLQGSERDAARAKASIDLLSNVRITVSLDWMEEESNSINGQSLNANDPFKGFLLAPGVREVAHDSDEFEVREVYGAAFNTRWRLNSGALIESISAKRRSKFNDLSEEDYSPLPIANSQFDEDFDQFSQELRLVSRDETDFRYVVGAFYSEQNIRTVRGARFLAPTGDRYLTVVTPGEMNNTSSALFGSLTAQLTDALSLNLGLRVQSEEKQLEYSIADTTGLFTNGDIDEKQSFSSYLPRLSLNFSLNENGLLYYSAARGAKSGGWNADFVRSLTDLSFDQETATSFEIGYKNLFLDDKLSINITAFKTNFRDFQVFQFVANNGSTLIDITNAGEATSQGMEIDTTYFLTEEFSFTLSATALRAQFDKFDNATLDGRSFAGNSLPYSPELSAHFAANYSKELSSAISLRLHIDYSYSDRYFSNPSNDPAFQVGSFFQTNAHIGLNFNGKWEISVWGENLSDETYLQYQDISFLDVQRGYYAPPRQYGLRLKYGH